MKQFALYVGGTRTQTIQAENITHAAAIAGMSAPIFDQTFGCSIADCTSMWVDSAYQWFDGDTPGSWFSVEVIALQ